MEQISVRDVRNINKLNIMRTIIENRDLSRNDISSANNISVMTVKNIVDDLLKKNIIVEKKIDSSLIGRKPTALSISDSVGKILTMDMTSKTLFYYIIYDIYGQKVDKRYYKCDINKDYITNLRSFLEILKKDLDRLNVNSLLGIGVAVPGVYYADDDRVSNELIKELNSIRLRSIIYEYFDVDNLIIEHDVKMAAVAEAKGTGNMNQKGLYYFYVGEGVGGALIINGDVYSGSNELAGDVGQFIVDCNNKKNEVSNLESIIAIPAIVYNVKKSIAAEDMRKMHEKPYMELDFKSILEMYKAGDKLVGEHFEYVLTTLSRVIFNIVWLFNPGKIIIGSTYGEFSNIMVDFSSKYLEHMLENRIGIDLSITASKFDENSALIGLFEMLLTRWIERV